MNDFFSVRRILTLIGVVVYIAAQVYVNATVTPHDDDLPEIVRHAIMRLALINPTDGDQ